MTWFFHIEPWSAGQHYVAPERLLHFATAGLTTEMVVRGTLPRVSP